MEARKPLGIIELETGLKEIFPTNDFFLNYMFDKPEYWEVLRNMVNIFVRKYKTQMPETKVCTIDGEIQVETQYSYYMGKINVSKNQDLKITELAPNMTFVEVQNKASTKPPIETRAIEYLGLSLGHNSGKNITQIWILAEDVDSVLKGEIFANYVFKNEQTGESYPINTSLMFISLRKLAPWADECAELAQFLLGKNSLPTSETVKAIIKGFEKAFVEMKDDKEAKFGMSALDKYRLNYLEEGREEGREEGIEIGQLSTAKEMYKDGFTLEQIVKYVTLPIDKVKEAIAAI